MTLLQTTNAVANLSVRELDTAREFYEGTLGLTPVEVNGEELVVYKTGDSALNVYRSEYAGTNKATAVTWAVGEEFSDLVQDLRKKGVPFEHYDMPGVRLEGDVHVDGEMKIAWFKDPDGNILNIVNT